MIANDHNAYAATLARCYVQADRDDVREDAERLIGALSERLELGRFVFPAYEDAVYWKARESELPVNVTTAAAAANSSVYHWVRCMSPPQAGWRGTRDVSVPASRRCAACGSP